MSTNSRFPIDLAELSVVEFCWDRRPATRILIPTVNFNAVSTSRSPGSGAHAWAVGLLSERRKAGGSLEQDPSCGPAIARGRRVRHADELRPARVPLAITCWRRSARPAFAWHSETTVIGFAASFLLPARAGEVLRPYLLAKREGLPPTACFATIILERVAGPGDRAASLRRLRRAGRPGVALRRPALLCEGQAGGLLRRRPSLVGLVMFFFLAGHPERLGVWALRVERILRRRSPGPWPGSSRVSRRGSRSCASRGTSPGPSRWSFPLCSRLRWVSGVTSHAFHMTFSYLGSFLVMDAPRRRCRRSDAGPGRRLSHRVSDRGDDVLGVNDATAVGAALVLHAISFVPVTILGLVFMAREA